MLLRCAYAVRANGYIVRGARAGGAPATHRNPIFCARSGVEAKRFQRSQRVSCTSTDMASNDSAPPYQRIAHSLRRRIESGHLRPGDRVPSTRAIARKWGVALATAAHALSALGSEGLVRTVPRAGTVVANVAAKAAASRAQPDLTRGRIVEAAMAIADAEGLAAVSLRGVASRLGAPVTSLYRHVDGKEELLRAMTDSALGEGVLPAASFRLARTARARGAHALDHPPSPSLAGADDEHHAPDAARERHRLCRLDTPGARRPGSRRGPAHAAAHRSSRVHPGDGGEPRGRGRRGERDRHERFGVDGHAAGRLHGPCRDRSLPGLRRRSERAGLRVRARISTRCSSWASGRSSMVSREYSRWAAIGRYRVYARR